MEKSDFRGFLIRKARIITIYRYLLVLTAVIFLAGLTGQADALEQQAARPLAWTEIDKPGINGEIVIAPSEINRMVISQNIVYVLDTVNKKIHRSDNGGLTFIDITNALLRYGAVLPAYEIAVAPDRPRYVAVVTDNREKAYFSDDNGSTWQDMLLPAAMAGNIQCIAISNGYSSDSTLLHDIAIGTAIWGTNQGDGEIWTYQTGKISSWRNEDPLIPGAGPGADVSALAFSPGYAGDYKPYLLAVASDNATTYLCIGNREHLDNTTTWNGEGGYPKELVVSAEGDTSGASISSYISLPSDYQGNISFGRISFVSYNRYPNTLGIIPPGNMNDVYLINDAIGLKQRLNATSVSENISSVAYFGDLKSGKLLAGFVDPIGQDKKTAQVKWRSIDPNNPTYSNWSPANQPPSGPGNAQVAWSSDGAVALCGTGQYTSPGPLYDESSFSQSLDNGNNWMQTSLMNTSLIMTDIAPAPDSRSLFMASYSEAGPESIWRSAGEPLGRYWGRLLNMPTNTEKVILRLSPDYQDDYTVYAVEADNINSVDNLTISSNLLQVSESRGRYWKKRFIPRPVIDLVAASQHTLYLATTGGCVRKSTDGGLKWGEKVMTSLDDISMLAVRGNGHIFAGSRDGWVAYSTDEGASFTKLPKPVSFNMTDVQVEPDAGYSTNNVIYASGRTAGLTDAGVWRWTIGQSTQWEQIDTAITALNTGEQISGLKVGPEGTLYVLRAETFRPANLDWSEWESDNWSLSDNSTLLALSANSTGGMNRTLDPLYPIPEAIEWDHINRTLPDNETAFNPAPLGFAGNVPWLKLSGDANENDLWAIDTSNKVANDDTTAIYLFRDNVCKIGPWTTGPSEVGCDPVTGRNQQTDLLWEQLSLSDRYDLQIAKDPAFALRIDPAISNSDNISSVTGSIHILTDTVNVTSPGVWLSPGSLPEAGADYYWRLRTYHAATGEYIRSPWSDILNFIVKPGFPVKTPYYGPQLLAPADGCDCAFNAPVSFSWTPYKETTAYKFELSERYDMVRPLVSTIVSSPAYLYTGQLRNGTACFWRVTAVEPVPAESSAIFSFHTAAISSAAPDYLIPRSQQIPLWVVIGFAIGMLAIIVLLVLIFRRWGVLP